MPFQKWVYSKRKESAPKKGSKFFPFRIDPFLEEDKINLDSYLPWKCIHTP